MKDRTNRRLLLYFLFSMALCVFAWLFDIFLFLFLLAVPALCLQLLLCRVKRLRALPLLLTAAVAALGYHYRWPNFGRELTGAFLLLSSIGLAVGCVMGWTAYGLSERYKRGENGG